MEREREGERDGGDVEGRLLTFYRKGSILERTVAVWLTQQIISVVNPSLTRGNSGKPPRCPMRREKPAFYLECSFFYVNENREVKGSGKPHMKTVVWLWF